MRRKLDQWTTALTAVLLVGALLACKKKTTDTTAPTASATTATTTTAAPLVAPPTPEATAAVAEVGAKLGDVKRYPDKEKAQTGAARILQDGVKVFDEADDKTADVATLDKDLLVFRLASIPDWELVEFPSGVGKVSPGWVPAKSLDIKSDSTVKREAVATQTKTAVVKPASSAAPKSSASAVASTTKTAPSASAVAVTPAAASAQVAAALASAQAAAAAASAQTGAAPLTRAQQIAARAAARGLKTSTKP
jgi:hypothetical protein